jgi:hypothetical protein
MFENFPTFYGTRKLLLCSKEPSICSYPKSDQSNPHKPTLSLSKAVYAHCKDASGGSLARHDSQNGYLPRPCACLVWRQPRGEPTPVGFLTCSKVPRCELLALTGLPRVLYSKWTRKSVDAMVASRELRLVQPRCYSRQLTVEAASRSRLARRPRNVRTRLKIHCNIIHPPTSRSS